MSRALRIGTGLFVLGIVGLFYIADKLFVQLSGLWYSTIIASLIMAVVGLVLLWKEWGLKSSKSRKSTKTSGSRKSTKTSGSRKRGR